MTSRRVRIWWDEAASVYHMTFPYDKGLVYVLETAVPWKDRSFDKATKVWSFDEKYLIKITEFCKGIFGELNVSVASKDDARHNTVEQTSKIPIDTACKQFIELIKFPTARRAYLNAIQECHPDKGGDGTIAASLNATWDRIQREVFNRM